MPKKAKSRDAPPQWPLQPFSRLSQRHGFPNLGWAKWNGTREIVADPRERYGPTPEDFAAFRRWSIIEDPCGAVKFNPRAPDWPWWREVLIDQCRVPRQAVVSMTVPDIVARLKYTPVPDEMRCVTAALRQMAALVKSVRDVELAADVAADLLLKLHAPAIWEAQNPGRDLKRIAHRYCLDRRGRMRFIQALAGLVSADFNPSSNRVGTCVVALMGLANQLDGSTAKSLHRQPEKQPDLPKEARALAALVANPTWTDAKIAEAAGCNRTSLYRMPRYQKAKAMLKSGRTAYPKGQKDGETGQVEAYEE